jgi:hypothetical protein
VQSGINAIKSKQYHTAWVTIMQITIDIPDNLSPAIIQQQITEFEAKLKALTPNPKEQKQLAMQQLLKKCASLPTIDPRSADEILGYDANAMGLWGDQ